MTAVFGHNVLEELWNALATQHRGVMMISLDLLAEDPYSPRADRPCVSVHSALEALVGFTKTRLILLSEKKADDCGAFIPASWPVQQISKGGWRAGNATVILRAGLQNKVDTVRRISRETVGVPGAYLGCDSSDEPVFRALNPGVAGIMVGLRHRPIAAHVHFSSRRDLVRFLDGWISAFGGQQAVSG